MFSNRTRIILPVIHLLLFAYFMYAGNTYLSLLMILGIFFRYTVTLDTMPSGVPSDISAHRISRR